MRLEHFQNLFNNTVDFNKENSFIPVFKFIKDYYFTNDDHLEGITYIYFILIKILLFILLNFIFKDFCKRMQE
jgi:ABC-type polysaccharide/polyol phosphate export permease